MAKVVDECLAKGVRALVVISAGFGEASDDGRASERAMLEKIRAAGVRLVGPELHGPDEYRSARGAERVVRAQASPPRGRVALATQSGALGLAMLEYIQRLHFGLSTFVSVGNKLDVSGNDLIQYWAADERTDVILLYLESFGNPKNFSTMARRVSRQKPIVALKAGRSQVGARAASSHTGALASNDAVVDALFTHSGVIRANTLEEFFDVATLLAHQPLPKGRRVAIVTNAGGPGILAADAAEAHGIELATLSDETVETLRGIPAQGRERRESRRTCWPRRRPSTIAERSRLLQADEQRGQHSGDLRAAARHQSDGDAAEAHRLGGDARNDQARMLGDVHQRRRRPRRRWRTCRVTRFPNPRSPRWPT